MKLSGSEKKVVILILLSMFQLRDNQGCLLLTLGQDREGATPGLGVGLHQGEDTPDPEAIQDLRMKVLAGAVRPLGETSTGVVPRKLSQGRGTDLGLRTWTVLHTAMFLTRMSQ